MQSNQMSVNPNELSYSGQLPYPALMTVKGKAGASAWTLSETELLCLQLLEKNLPSRYVFGFSENFRNAYKHLQVGKPENFNARVGSLLSGDAVTYLQQCGRIANVAIAVFMDETIVSYKLDNQRHLNSGQMALILKQLVEKTENNLASYVSANSSI